MDSPTTNGGSWHGTPNQPLGFSPRLLPSASPAYQKKLHVNLPLVFLLLFTILFNLTAWSQGNVAESPAKNKIKSWRPHTYDQACYIDIIYDQVVKRTGRDFITDPPTTFHHSDYFNGYGDQGYYYHSQNTVFVDTDLDQDPEGCTLSNFDNLVNEAGILGWVTHGGIHSPLPNLIPYVVVVSFAQGALVSENPNVYEGEISAQNYIGSRTGLFVRPHMIPMSGGSTRCFAVVATCGYFLNRWNATLDSNKTILLALSCSSSRYTPYFGRLIDDIGGRAKIGYANSVTIGIANIQMAQLFARMNGADPGDGSGQLREINDAYNWGGFWGDIPPSLDNSPRLRPYPAPLTTLCPHVNMLIDVYDYQWTDPTRTKWRVTHKYTLDTKSMMEHDVFYNPPGQPWRAISQTMVSDHELEVVWEMQGSTWGPQTYYTWRGIKASNGGMQAADINLPPNGDIYEVWDSYPIPWPPYVFYYIRPACLWFNMQPPP